MPIKIFMPALSPTMTEGNVVAWLKQEGEKVTPGDVLAEIETDKATMEVEAVDEGILGKIVTSAGTENVPVNSVIAVLLEEGEAPHALEEILVLLEPDSSVGRTDVNAELKLQKKPELEPQEVPCIPPAGSNLDCLSLVDPKAVVQTLPEQGARRLITPLARRLAGEHRIDLGLLEGTGPRGRIIKRDVEIALQEKGNKKGSGEEVGAWREGDGFMPAYQEIKLTQMRRIIAKRLTEAKQTVPHFYLTVTCEIDALLNARQQINESLSEAERISVTDFVIKACAMALKKVPAANASYAEAHIRLYETADISVAVAIAGGLVTPIIRQAERKSLGDISAEMKDLAKRARSGKLIPEEFQGGTFSLSNLGMYGVQEFAAVINPPQGCILAVGAGESSPVVKNGQVGIATLMRCTLSVDHRVVDGAVGAEFLNHFKKILETPVMLLV